MDVNVKSGNGWLSGPARSLVACGVVVLLLLIPLSWIRELLRERQGRWQEAASNIGQSWGAEQSLVGPILAVPYEVPRTVVIAANAAGAPAVERVERTVETAYFLPERLKIEGEVVPSVLHRGIHDVPVYRTALRIGGAFVRPAFGELGIPEGEVLWERASIIFSLSDQRGIVEVPLFILGGRAIAPKPGSGFDRIPNGIHADLGGPPAGGWPAEFSLALNLRGSGSLQVVPAGIQTDVSLTSSWKDPSFNGAFLPTEREVSPTGFKARWQISRFSRPFPERWTSTAAEVKFLEHRFGVDLIRPIDPYRLTDRALKHAVLFLVLVFTGYFLFETTLRLRIHLVQYGLVGAAVCLFYLALLSLSEAIPFGWAYLAGALVSTLLVTLYSWSLLRRFSRALIVTAELSGIWAYLYVTLQLADYALMVGTAALFAILGAVMYLTRRVDWYPERQTGEAR